MEDIKISELSETTAGWLYTIGVKKQLTKKVSLQFLKDAN